ncbi:MAG: DUF1549 and DUF1553 domain-containing protein [Gemmatales bacterium]|nr:DUF1549 and DUF1553 domain-containing protein [Gemmatales bacterium]MDW7995935.1 DUF1549 and DUF1553 domain-containing protein [Gemmatales bacterium]
MKSIAALWAVLAVVGWVVAQVNQSSTPSAKVSVQALPTEQVVQQVDAIILKHLAAQNIRPAGLSSDEEFLRRAYLDITGKIPTAEQAAAFLDSREANKRAQLIEQLLASPDYGRHFADEWVRLLVPRDSQNRLLRTQPLFDWLTEQFNQNRPWSEIVTALLTATGTQQENPAVTYFLANQGLDQITNSVCKLFLGNQLQCAQCHNHPFTNWKQNDYWAFAAFFAKVQRDNTLAAAKQGTSPGVRELPRIALRRNLPESYKALPPKFLGGAQPQLRASEPLRPVLAKWLTAPDNPYFAKATVNRWWAKFFGRGLVNPVDDMHEDNPPVYPELLDLLAQQFVAHQFDLKWLVRTITNTQAYQRSSKPVGEQPADPTLFAQMPVKPMTPAQLFDALAQVVGFNRNLAARKPAIGPKPGFNVREAFIIAFSGDEGADPLDYQAGIPHALRLMNSPMTNADGIVLQDALRRGESPEETLDWLFLGVLSRRPSAQERERFLNYVAQRQYSRAAWSDVFWALINSSEFVLTR